MCITNETKAFYSNINAFFGIEIFMCQFYFLFILEFSLLSPPNKRSKSMKSICQQKVSTQSIKL